MQVVAIRGKFDIMVDYEYKNTRAQSVLDILGQLVKESKSKKKRKVKLED